MKSRKYLHWKDLMQRYGVSRATCNRWLGQGLLPKPIYVSTTPLWLESDLDAFDAERSVGK